MKKNISIKILLLIAFFTLASSARIDAQSAPAVLKKAAQKLRTASGVSCDFSIRQDQGNMSGTLKAKGSKFAITTPAASTWYDGKTMWTANARTKETTVTTPTASEICETNPLSYINGYESQYRIGFSRRKEKGKYLVVLNPKQKNTGIRGVEIDLDAKTLLPVHIYIRTQSGQLTSVAVKNVRTGSALAESTFTYPASKMSGYEVVDLR